jgi:Ras-related protein Rab-5C
MDSQEDDRSYKVIAVGPAGVGKTSIVHRYSTGFFQEAEQTIGVSYIKCDVELVSGSVTLNVWDTAGQEKFQSLIPLYLRGADACIVVFDIRNANSVDEVDRLYNHVHSNLDDDVFIVLCANKVDLVDRIKDPPGIIAWTTSKKIQYFRTSAVTGEGIDALFYAVASGVHETEANAPMTTPTAQVKASGCCQK